MSLTVVRIYLATLVLLASCSFTNGLLAKESPQSDEFFEAKIRPVLIDSCYECHNSNDVAEGGLAVDWRGALIQGGDSGPAIVPGKPDESRLLAVIRHEVPGLEMPEGGPKLAPQVLEDFQRWIAEGAHDPRDAPPTEEELAQSSNWPATVEKRRQWWSFQAIQSVTPPELASETINNQTVNNQSNPSPIDRFILKELASREITPSPTAPTDLLIRRLFLVLHGKPPTTGELELWKARFDSASLEDKGTNEWKEVYEQLVDELIASPHFGERWARHWMDWVRYAESHGSEGDPTIPNAWAYRDYLIRSLNADVPIDQMIREYVTGDLLANPRINAELGLNESVLGVIPWRMVFHGFSPTDALDERVRFTDDHINTMTKAFLGLTVSCARCHDHKFDPISQRDYFALYGIVTSTRVAQTVADTEERQALHCDTLNELKQQIKQQLATQWLEQLPQLPQRLKTILDQQNNPVGEDSVLWPLTQIRQQDSTWQEQLGQAEISKDVLQQLVDKAPAHWDLSNENDWAHWTAKGIGLLSPVKSPGEFHISTQGPTVVKKIFPAGTISNSLSEKHASRLTSPNFTVQPDSQLWVYAAGDGGATLRYVVHDYPRFGLIYPITTLTPQWQWYRFDLSYWSNEEIHVELAHARDIPLPQSNSIRSWFAVRDVMMLPKGVEPPTPLARPWQVLADHLPTPSSSLNESKLIESYQQAAEATIQRWLAGNATDVDTHFLEKSIELGILTNNQTELSSVASSVDEYRRLEEAIPPPTRVPGLDDLAGIDRPLFVRGDHKQPADPVKRGFIDVIEKVEYDNDHSGRLELADSILSDNNPLTARVMANRLWTHLFGKGIVATPDNFGLLGNEPTHPELLDWLANRLREQDWSLKKFVKEVVLSETWQRSSIPTASAVEEDPDNRWLAHSHLRRLDAESLRDQLLVVSGLLDDKLYGEPVAGNTPRRSVYVSVIRNRLDPFLRAFDFPEPFSCTGQRTATNVPAQSLMLMNDPFVRNCATKWVERTLASLPTETEAKQTEAIVAAQMLEQILGRPLQAAEQSLLELHSKLLEQQATEDQRSRDRLNLEIHQLQTDITAIIEPTRKRLLERSSNGEAETPSTIAPTPVMAWNFSQVDQSVSNDSPSAPITLSGTAHQTAQGLVTGPGGYASTELKVDVRAKTLEAWLQLDNLQQQGGGVISIQTRDGNLFDSIVFGEQQPQHWLAGSEFFARTSSFKGPAEQKAAEHPIQVAITYDDNGRIQCYRQGVPYGEAYTTAPPRVYRAGESLLTFGLRHLPAGGNKHLQGTIVSARLYDRALAEEEIMASFQNGPRVISEEEMIAALDDPTRKQLAAFRQQLQERQQDLDRLGTDRELTTMRGRLIERARAYFMLQETQFIQ